MIIPVYISEKAIFSSICSIQNQLYTDFAIILIDDYSNDNSSKIIQSLQKKDKRIKIIKNQKKHGHIIFQKYWSFTVKGKSIFALDTMIYFFLMILFISS